MLLLSPAVRSAGVRLRSLAALLLLSLQPVGGQSAPTRATPPVAFTLDDQFGKRWTEESLSGRWTVLLAGQREHAEVLKAWSDSLHRAFATDAATVRWLMVADLRGIPRVMHRLASQRAPREPHRRLLLDHDGRIARQLSLGRDAYTVVVLSPTGAVTLRLVDPLLNSAQLETVRHFIGKP
jgi:hypothetical protein